VEAKRGKGFEPGPGAFLFSACQGEYALGSCFVAPPALYRNNVLYIDIVGKLGKKRKMSK